MFSPQFTYFSVINSRLCLNLCVRTCKCWVDGWWSLIHYSEAVWLLSSTEKEFCSAEQLLAAPLFLTSGSVLP